MARGGESLLVGPALVVGDRVGAVEAVAGDALLPPERSLVAPQGDVVLRGDDAAADPLDHRMRPAATC